MPSLAQLYFNHCSLNLKNQFENLFILFYSQGDYVWLEPDTKGEFDVGVGAKVKAIDNGNYCVIDDDNKVCAINMILIEKFIIIHSMKFKWVLQLYRKLTYSYNITIFVN